MHELISVLFLLSTGTLPAMGQGIPKPPADQRVVRPKEIHDVLNNPGIGFHTFQRFNGDELNPGIGWTEGHPIEYQEFDGDLTNPDFPATTTAYFRVYWRYVEPRQEEYNWAMFDKALKTAAERGQTLCLRIAPYAGGKNEDVPDWYRKLVGPEPKLASNKWRTDPENPNYVKFFGGMIRALGQRYDGHPDLEWVDVSIVGFWGEGDGSHRLSDATRSARSSSQQMPTSAAGSLAMWSTTAQSTSRWTCPKGSTTWSWQSSSRERAGPTSASRSRGVSPTAGTGWAR